MSIGAENGRLFGYENVLSFFDSLGLGSKCPVQTIIMDDGPGAKLSPFLAGFNEAKSELFEPFEPQLRLLANGQFARISLYTS